MTKKSRPAPSAKSLANLRPFAKGISGNPGGKPKGGYDLREIARAHTPEALETVLLVLRNGKPGEALEAAKIILDRGWGKPPQSIAGDGDGLLMLGVAAYLPAKGSVTDG